MNRRGFLGRAVLAATMLATANEILSDRMRMDLRRR